MNRMRIPLFIALGVAVIGIVFGSLFDLQISQAIASPSNAFALTISAIFPTLGFAGVAAMGGGLFALALKGKYPIALKILLYVLAACSLGVSVYYPHGEYFGINGFYGAAPEWVGYFIVVVPECAAAVGGYFLFKDCQNKNMWIVFVIIIGLLLIALMGVIPNIKDNMHRPRYRLISTTDITVFHNWWEPLKNYDELKDLSAHDNFKSFPSGHTAEVSILFVVATLFPLADKKLEKYQLPAFLVASVLVLVVALARIMAAAHYLSDVSWGATIVLVLLVIANEVIARVKALHVEEQE